MAERYQPAHSEATNSQRIDSDGWADRIASPPALRHWHATDGGSATSHSQYSLQATANERGAGAKRLAVGSITARRTNAPAATSNVDAI